MARLTGLLLWILLAVGGWAGTPRRVLLLHTYHQDFSWTANIHAALIQRLQRAEPSLDLRTEYLDWKHFPQPAMLEHARRQLEAKYGNLPFDLVITSDNVAMDFALAHRAVLFPKASLVFCGYNGFEPSRLAGVSGVTGVAERVDAAGTLGLALRLHRGVRKVRVICDLTESGRAIRAELEAALPTMGPLPPLVFSGAESTEALVASLAEEPPSTLILVGLFTNDGKGRALDLWELPFLLNRAGVSAPVWGLYEEAMGRGIVGGRLQSGQRQGEWAAALAMRVLAGESAESLPVVDVATVRPVFDHRELVRFGVAPSDLPWGAELRYAPESFYVRHRSLVLGSLGLSMLAALGLGMALAWRVSREHSLRRSEARLRGLVQHMPLLTCAVDAQGRFLLWNRACAEATGLTPEDLEAMPEPLGVLFPDPAMRRGFLTLASAEGDLELPLRHRAGSVRVIRWFSQAKGFPIPGWAGWMVGVDVTAQREAESARRRLALAMSQSGDGILLADLTGRVTDANPAVSRMLGLPPDSLLGRDLGGLFAASGAALPKEIGGDGAWQGRVRIPCPGGAVRVLALARFPVREAETVTATAMVLHDLTEQLALEEQVARTQRMESLGTLAAGVAHDFRNLMSAVLGSADILVEELEASPLRPHLDRLKAAAQRGVALVQQLLGFARSCPEALAPVPVAALLEELEMLAGHGLPARIRLQVAPPSEELVVQGDAGQLLQVLLNLVLNARDALPEGGEIRVAATGTEREVCLAVSDDGIGMTREVLARAFEPMFTTKAPGVGTGMGLAMVYRLVTSHGGQVTVDSEPGRGTTFRVRLPRG